MMDALQDTSPSTKSGMQLFFDKHNRRNHDGDNKNSGICSMIVY